MDPMRRTRFATLNVLAPAILAMLATPRPAWAAFGDPEIRTDLAAGYSSYQSNRRYHGIGGALTAQYVFGTTWGLTARYGASEHEIRGASFEVHQLGLGGRYRLDVFEYVPYLEVAPTAYLTTGSGGPQERPAAGLRFGMGFDRLLGDRVTLGCGLHYHRLFSESVFPSYLEVQLSLGFRWSLGDPLAP